MTPIAFWEFWSTDFAVLPRATPSGWLWAASPLARGCAGSASIGIAPRRLVIPAVSKFRNDVDRSMPSPHPWAAVLLLVNDEDGRMFIQFPVPAAIRQDIDAGCEKASTVEAFAFLGQAYLRNLGACQMVMELCRRHPGRTARGTGALAPAHSLRL